MRTAPATLLLALYLGAAPIGCRPRATDAPPTGGVVAHPAPPPSDAALPAGDGGSVAASPAPARPPAPRPAKVKIILKTAPPNLKAKVFWGKKLLGVTPYQLDRPRDSGPVDLILRADGHFPVHTRAYTTHDEKLTVKMTKLEDRMTLLGARKELPPPEPLPDGGAAPPGAGPFGATPTSVSSPTTPPQFPQQQ